MISLKGSSRQRILPTVTLAMLFAVTIGVFFLFGNLPSQNDKSSLTAGISASASSDAPASFSSAAPSAMAPASQAALPPLPIIPQVLELDAKAAYAEDFPTITEKKLASKNADTALPIASLTKLMTALVVLQHYDLDQLVTVSPTAMRQIGEQGDLKEGQVMTVRDLLYIALIESSNRAAEQLAEVMGRDAFISLMNQEARELGLDSTHYADSSGLDAGSVSTARDVAKLSEYLFENYPLFRQIVGTKTYNLYLPDGTFHHQLQSTDQLLGSFPGIVGGKTGYTNEAQGCFMAVRRNPLTGMYSVNVILGSPDRFAEMEKMINWNDAHSL